MHPGSFRPAVQPRLSAGSVGFASRMALGKRFRSSTRAGHKRSPGGAVPRPSPAPTVRDTTLRKNQTARPLDAGLAAHPHGHHAHHVILLRRFHQQRLYLPPSRFLISCPQIRNPASHRARGWNRKRKSRARADGAVNPFKWVRPVIRVVRERPTRASLLFVGEYRRFNVLGSELRTRATRRIEVTLDRKATVMHERQMEGQIYYCESCDSEINVVQPVTGARANPRCRCGAQMKKPYRKPSVRKMNVPIETLAVAKTNRN
jgi:hypothetical protein